MAESVQRNSEAGDDARKGIGAGGSPAAGDVDVRRVDQRRARRRQGNSAVVAKSAAACGEISDRGAVIDH